MMRVILLVFVTTLCSLRFAEGLECLTCINARSEAECLERGEMRECQGDQQMSCETEIRYFSDDESPMITKRCKQSLACENDQLQNESCDSRNGVCRCCCQEDGCDRDNFWCSAAIVDPCQENPCENGGACVSNGRGGYSCNCGVGFSGSNCQTDVCSTNNCLNGGTCIRSSDTRGYNCECAEGFDGENCGQAVDPCRGNPCRNGGACSIVPGGYVCACRVGFSGAACEIDSCNPNRCSNGGTCDRAQNERGYVCRCRSGFRGENCDEDACNPNNCLNGGTCKRSSNRRGYNCECAEGFDGENCGQVIDPCRRNPCRNGGFCSVTSGGYVCACRIGFSGASCEIDSCNPNRCSNGGTCNRAQNERGYVCRCRDGFSGENCGEVIPNPCRNNPCQNGGSCSRMSGGFACSCRVGFSGSNCQFDSCSPNQCLNGGTCIRSRNRRGYVCRCDNGFRGDNCGEEPADACAPNPCRNGGRCSNTRGGYSCSCPAGFSGRNCGLDACNPNPCLNGGSCGRVANSRGYRCTCRSGFSGSNCGISNPCQRNPCQNGGVCNTIRGGYECTCAAGFSGSNCRNEIRCELLIQPANGRKTCQFSDVEGEIGSVCAFSCDAGYRPVGLLISTCRLRGQSAQFTVPAPSCVRISVEVPTAAPTTSRASEGPGRLTNRCDQKPERPTNGGRSCFAARGTVVCIYFCDRDYYLFGKRVLACNPSTGFDGTTPQCLRSARCNIPQIANGQLSCDGNGEVGTTCSFRCNSGCNLVGQSRSQCVIQNGKASWSCGAPSCQRQNGLQK